MVAYYAYKKISPDSIPRICRELRAARIAKNLTLKDAAVHVGYDHTALGKSERRVSASVQRIINYAEFLGYEIALVPKDPKS